VLNIPNTNVEQLEEIERLRLRLEEAEAVVEAIRKGMVDAVVVHSPSAEMVYTLEGAERPYRLLVEAMQQAVAVLNSKGVVLYCNLCFAELFKMSVQNITGCAIDSFAAEADAMLSDILKNVENKSDHKATATLLRRQDGTTFPAALTASVLPGERFCFLISDLTQQQHYDEMIVSKAALADSEIRYRRLFESAKDGLLILDKESGKINDANPFMSELLGYSREHFLGKELWEIGIFSDKAANETAVRTLQDKGYIRYEHLPLETSRGLRVEVEIIASAYREGRHKVIQCNIRDITERSRLEKKTHEQASALTDLDHRKNEFLAMLSHELRNPLAAITNALQMFSLQKHEDPLQSQARTIIKRQIGQLIRLVDDLMEVSRITSGRIHLQKEQTELNSIVERAVETARSLIDQHRHELTVSLSPQAIWLHADPSRLEQVVVNLLINAAKYTAEGGKIAITAERQGDGAVLRVRDSGVGIAPELLPRIFDLFTQSHRTLDRSQGGLGIGLSLVQRLTEMHGGRVEVSSVLGQGSEFAVHLPVILNPAAQPQLQVQVPDAPMGLSLRVLVVEDNKDVARLLELLLKKSGHDVRTAYDGHAALEAASDFLPQVVLLDIGLPGIDGYGVAKRLRQDSNLTDVMLIAMTGYGQESDRKLSHDAGFNHHLVKPADFAKVLKLLSTVSQTQPK